MASALGRDELEQRLMEKACSFAVVPTGPVHGQLRSLNNIPREGLCDGISPSTLGLPPL